MTIAAARSELSLAESEYLNKMQMDSNRRDGSQAQECRCEEHQRYLKRKMQQCQQKVLLACAK